MAKHVIIPTREEDSEKLEDSPFHNLLKYFESAGWKVHIQRNKPSIFDAYEDGVYSLKPKDSDKIILCHDDIRILTDKDIFNEILDSLLAKNKTGFIGVAGSAVMLAEKNWFASTQLIKNAGGGHIYHGNISPGKSIDSVLSCYGPRKNAVILDGVFLAASGKTLKSIQLKKPKKFVGGWHWYDHFYTMQTFKKGLINRVAPISLIHKSGGNYDKSFYDDMDVFHELFSNDLPAVVNDV